MTTTARRPRRVVAGRLEADANNPRPGYVPGDDGSITFRVADTIVELKYGTVEEPLSVVFPCEHKRDGLWAVAQIACSDRSMWSLGIGGWVPDVFPTLEAAVRAACNPADRKAMLARQRWQQELQAIETRLREHYAAEPAAPESACDPGYTRRTVIPGFLSL